MRSTVAEIDKFRVERYVSPTAEAIAMMAVGDLTPACRAVQDAAVQRDANFALYRKMRLFDPIRQTPAFQETLTAMRL